MVAGRWGNEGKVSVEFGPGPHDHTNYMPDVESAHKEADRIIKDREIANKAKEERTTLIEGALSGYSNREAEHAMAYEIGGGSRPTETQISGFIRKRYGTTIEEARRHARRVTRRAGFIDAGGTSRANVTEVIKYLQSNQGSIEKKGS